MEKKISYITKSLKLRKTKPLCFPVMLGSILELPAETCKEIKASEGGEAVSGKYWLDSIIPGETVLAHCDMENEGNEGEWGEIFNIALFPMLEKKRKGARNEGRMLMFCAGERECYIQFYHNRSSST